MQRKARGNYSNRSHSFAVAPTVSMPRSTFPHPSRTQTTIDAGILYPVFVDLDVLPGDTYRIKMNSFGRLATPYFPFMDNLWLDYHAFFVPHRIVWENWEKLQGARANPDSSVDFTVPQIEVAGGTSSLALGGYFGIPVQSLALEVSALPFRAYNKIWNEFYRDQNVSDSLVEDTGDANSTEANHVLKRRMKRKDYLTSCLPWPQKGDSVDLPIGVRADIKGIGKLNQNFATGPQTVYETGETGSTSFADFQAIGASADQTHYSEEDPANAGFPNIYADLTTATAVSVNTFRTAIAMQHILELDARAGTRTPELLKARWGVTSPDSRLQRPEYLAGSSQNISVIPVPLTSEASTGIGGGQRGYGITAGGLSCTHSFTEHGTIIILASIRADYTYYAGIHRMWTRTAREDFYEPALAMLGEQPVYNKEVFSDGTGADETVFGYQERWAEYKYGKSMCTGLMRPNAAGTLSQWNLAEEVDVHQVLSEAYLEENPPIDRVIVVDTEPHLLLDCFYDNAVTRVMPVHNVPGLTRL